MRSTIGITGFIVGGIWWPVGAECWKDLNYSVTDQQARTSGKMTLRDHLLAVTNDGDFQNCTVACGNLAIRREFERNGRRIVETRHIPLERFPSIADMLHPEGQDWCPSHAEDFEDA